jgi:hypothetical protein
VPKPDFKVGIFLEIARSRKPLSRKGLSWYNFPKSAMWRLDAFTEAEQREHRRSGKTKKSFWQKREET